MAASSKRQVLSLFKQLLKEGHRVTDYNVRNYALRRTRDAFKEYKTVENPSEIEELIIRGQNNLDVLKRQATISQLFGSGKLIIENKAGET